MPSLLLWFLRLVVTSLTSNFGMILLWVLLTDYSIFGLPRTDSTDVLIVIWANSMLSIAALLGLMVQKTLATVRTQWVIALAFMSHSVVLIWGWYVLDHSIYAYLGTLSGLAALIWSGLCWSISQAKKASAG